MNTWLSVLLVISLCAHPLQWWFWHRLGTKRVFMAGTKLLTEQVGTLQLELERAREKTSRYFEKISDFERERNEWKRLYESQSIGHGNAQSLMMDTIERMGKLLTEKGIRYQIPHVLEEVRSEYLEKHELPARESAKQLKSTS